MEQQGKLIVVSGPSGVGKTTLLRELRRRCPIPLKFSVSATTRKPRHGELDGVDYHFLTHDEFAARRQAGEFLECFEVFGRGDWYGTLADQVFPQLAQGVSVLLEIDANGAAHVVEKHPQTITIFILPDSMAGLRARLSGRGSESPEALERRFAEADREMAAAGRFKYQVTNDQLDRAVDELIHILCSAENG